MLPLCHKISIPKASCGKVSSQNVHIQHTQRIQSRQISRSFSQNHNLSSPIQSNSITQITPQFYKQTRQLCTSPPEVVMNPPPVNILQVGPLDPELKARLEAIATENIRSVLNVSLKLQPTEKLVVIYDTMCPLAEILKNAYTAQRNDNPAEMIAINFEQTQPDYIKNVINELTPGDLVVLVQTTSFRLDDYRFRIQLFNRKLKTIEHPHIGQVAGPEHEAYINALGFVPNPPTLRLANFVKSKMDNSKRTVVKCDNTELVYEGGMEPALLNIGDYTGMSNVGGTFPVGEIFSEPKDLFCVNGEVMVFGYPHRNRLLEIPSEPFKVTIEKGRLVKAEKAPESFTEMMDAIKQLEGEIVMREFGIGLNSAMGKNNRVSDITAFERQLGLHMSLGKKHTVFKKPGINTRSRFHIDMFADVKQILIDDQVVYDNGKFPVE